VTPSWDRGRLARIGSAQRTRQPVSAMCPGFGNCPFTTRGWLNHLANQESGNKNYESFASDTSDQSDQSVEPRMVVGNVSVK